MRIYLLGYMGAGKTSLGKKLAKKLEYDFIDLDYYIEEQTKLKISEIFQKNGENYFREIETKFLKLLSNNFDKIVISTGGGTPCYNNNIDLMNTNGTTVYIKLSAKSLHLRLTQSKTKRPLIEGKTSEELQHFIETHLKQRELYYLKSQFTIKGENLTPKKLLNTICQLE